MPDVINDEARTMTDTVLRQIEMLRMIPRTGVITPQQLKQRLAELGYAITVRSVQRDLNQLSAVFSLECDDSGKPHGWRWSPGMPVCQMPGLTTAEALAFQMLAQFDSDLLPATIRDQLEPYFAAAKQQLSSDVGPKATRNWLRKVRAVSPNQPLLPASIAPEVVRDVHAALMEERCLEIVYGIGKGRTYCIHPLGIVQHGPSLYLVANFDGHEDARILAMHRIQRATRLGRAARVPPGFTLDDYIASGAFGFGEMGQTAHVELRFFNHAGLHLKETPLSADQECVDEGDGRLYIKATLQLTPRLRWWLQGFGANVEVLGPASLRSDIASGHCEAAKRYA